MLNPEDLQVDSFETSSALPTGGTLGCCTGCVSGCGINPTASGCASGGGDPVLY
ncbi:MAG TPA: hypothetical protein VF092_05005 [Longimicrobium sp.]